jgi:DNA-binding CsgD family transcriptional regulator
MVDENSDDVFERHRGNVVLSALRRLRTPIFASPGNGDVRPVNRAAVELASLEGITPDLLRREPDHPLAAAIRSADQAAGNARRAVAAFPSGRRYEVEISARGRGAAERWMLIVVRSTLEASVSAIREVARRYRLTRREIDIVIAIAEGLSSEDVCLDMSISRNTLKTHLGSVFAKTKTSSRAELLSLLLRDQAPNE